MKTKASITVLLFLLLSHFCFADKLLIPMDLSQVNHLKAYGIVYWALTKSVEWDWLLNYRGGSFAAEYSDDIAKECRIRGVEFQTISDGTAQDIYAEVQSEGVNMDVVRLEKAPKIAVYVQPGNAPWDDAVRMALDYAEVKYDMIWDEEVLTGKLADYDWLHLHHEDFTGQFGKFYPTHGDQTWYIQQVALNEQMALKMGYPSVPALKKATVSTIRKYVADGGFLFAMCTATDTYDIALAAQNVDIVAQLFDGTPPEADYNNKLNFANTFAFQDFKVDPEPYDSYHHAFSDIDVGVYTGLNNIAVDYFTLFEFSAKYDPVPTMLTQNHVSVIKGFLGQTTSFHKDKLKPSVTVLAIKDGTDEVKYIQGNVGRGSFCWYGGHDPEDYQHILGDPPTDLNMYRSSPGYRLILNNILFPAAKKKTQKT
ncbi:MAG: asparagine synthetase B [Ignavibacteria bacterium]|nr:asparagine synthetase B [Ignavibacteria bacterium]